MDAVEGLGREALIYEELISKIAANVNLYIKNNDLLIFDGGAEDVRVAKSLQHEAKKKAERDQSLAQR